jgi:hypothetical protein
LVFTYLKRAAAKREELPARKFIAKADISAFADKQSRILRNDSSKPSRKILIS